MSNDAPSDWLPPNFRPNRQHALFNHIFGSRKRSWRNNIGRRIRPNPIAITDPYRSNSFVGARPLVAATDDPYNPLLPGPCHEDIIVLSDTGDDDDDDDDSSVGHMRIQAPSPAGSPHTPDDTPPSSGDEINP